MSSDKRTINLVIADTTYPATIQSEWEEEMFRKAAKQINERLNKSRLRYPKVGTERLMTMIAIDFAYRALTLEDKNNTQPFKEKLKELTGDMEKLFENAEP